MNCTRLVVEMFLTRPTGFSSCAEYSFSDMRAISALIKSLRSSSCLIGLVKLGGTPSLKKKFVGQDKVRNTMSHEESHLKSYKF